eukprot:gnl/TRDRNA2_/TRDRNA2_172412_c1_seq1.p1 gnl/TRDRNA2_/TRDRNA2_172412_c1~~gnl/TRDRNA2_/TRDRNA2_172412_c1_seq1.p1  ORF type:complete len:236 (+),score=26.56 gnl/TRDRNA2_/TRDRNA2_172412_c1_seq1:135-842(+)
MEPVDKEAAPVIISGAGPCGLMCALVLQRGGVPFVLVERAEEKKLTANVGSGLDMMETAMRIFGRLDLPIEQFVRGFATNTALGPEGSFWRTVHTGANFSHRSELQVALKTALDKNPVDARFGVGVSGYSETESSVKVGLTDGSSITGRALLACDGWKSRVRAQMLSHDPVRFCNISVWRAVCKRTPQLEDAGFELQDFTYCLPGRRKLGNWCCWPTGDDVRWCAAMQSLGHRTI